MHENANDLTRNELIQLLESYTSFAANFQSESRDDLNIVISHQTGIVRLTKPDRFLWRIHKPDEQTIAVQKDDVTVYDPLLEQVSYLKLQELSGSDVFRILMDPVTLQATDLRITSSQERFVIRSESESAIFAEINIWFDRGVLKEIVVHDFFDGFTRFTFSSVLINSKIAEQEFDVEIPEGTDVVGTPPNSE